MVFLENGLWQQSRLLRCVSFRLYGDIIALPKQSGDCSLPRFTIGPMPASCCCRSHVSFCTHRLQCTWSALQRVALASMRVLLRAINRKETLAGMSHALKFVKSIAAYVVMQELLDSCSSVVSTSSFAKHSLPLSKLVRPTCNASLTASATVFDGQSFDVGCSRIWKLID